MLLVRGDRVWVENELKALLAHYKKCAKHKVEGAMASAHQVKPHMACVSPLYYAAIQPVRRAFCLYPFHHVLFCIQRGDDSVISHVVSSMLFEAMLAVDFDAAVCTASWQALHILV